MSSASFLVAREPVLQDPNPFLRDFASRPTGTDDGTSSFLSGSLRYFFLADS